MVKTTFKLIEGLGMIQFKGDLNSKLVKEKISEAVSLQPPNKLEMITTENFSMGWMALDELLIFIPSENLETQLKKLKEGFKNVSSLILDVSNSRSIIELSGFYIRDILAKNTPVDLSPNFFKKGMFRRTRFGQVSVAFWCLEETKWFMVCRSSETEYVFQLLDDSNKQESLPVYFGSNF